MLLPIILFRGTGTGMNRDLPEFHSLVSPYIYL